MNRRATDQAIICPECKYAFPPHLLNQPDFLPCPSCGKPSRVLVFPAWVERQESSSPGHQVLEGEASCFYHPQKQAVVPCDSCGRFLCALCDLPLRDKHYCPSCLSAVKKQETLNVLKTRLTRYDLIALRWSILPALFWPITLITAPMALFMVIRHWNKPASIVHRSKIYMILAGLFALPQIMGWSIGFYILVTKSMF